MKRFTETEKWKDPWFRSLTPLQKCVFSFCFDNCNNAGFIEIDVGAWAFSIGSKPAEIEGAIKGLGRGLVGASGWIYVRTFLKHQKHLPLNPQNNPAHRQIVSLFKEQETRFPGLFDTVISGKNEAPREGLDSPIGIGIGEGNGEGVGGCKGGQIYSPQSRAALCYLNEKSGRHFRETASSLSVIQARLNEPEVDIDGIKLMIDRQCARWIGTDFAEYLRPETLFGKKKFDGYYAAKDLPISVPKNATPQKPDYTKGF